MLSSRTHEHRKGSGQYHGLVLPDSGKESRGAQKPAQDDQKRRGVRQAGFLRRRPIDEKAHRNEDGTERLHNFPADRSPSICLVSSF